MSATEFLSPIPPEKKKLLELKYNVYCRSFLFGNSDNKSIHINPNQSKQIGCYVGIIIDNKNKKIVCKHIEESSLKSLKTKLDLCCVIECLQIILNGLDDETRPYACIQINTDSIYTSNIIKDWMIKWKETNFQNRPNRDQIDQLYSICTPIGKNLETQFIPYHDVFMQCQQVATECAQIYKYKYAIGSLPQETIPSYIQSTIPLSDLHVNEVNDTIKKEEKVIIEKIEKIENEPKTMIKEVQIKNKDVLIKKTNKKVVAVYSDEEDNDIIDLDSHFYTSEEEEPKEIEVCPKKSSSIKKRGKASDTTLKGVVIKSKKTGY